MVAAVTLIQLAAVATGVVVLFAAFQKARSLESFRETLRLLGFPNAVVPGASAIFVSLEACVGMALVSGQMPLLAAVSGVGLSTAFVAASLWGLAGGRDVPCSCFGRGSRRLGRATLPLATSLLAIQLLYAAAAIAGGINRLEPGQVPSFAAGALGMVVAVGVAAALPTAVRIRSHRRMIAARWCADPGD